MAFKKAVLKDALGAAEIMETGGIPVSRNLVYSLIQECSKSKDLATGRRLQSLMIRKGFDSIPVLNDHIIRLFASCGSLHEANQAFRDVQGPSVYTWSTIISANGNLGQAKKAIELYHRMPSTETNMHTYSAALKACASTATLMQGRLIHNFIISSGSEDVFVGSSIVDMYAKCASLEEAWNAFDNLPNRNSISWNAMIAGYAEHGHGLEALKLVGQMQQEGMKPETSTYLSSLKACSKIENLNHCRLLHNTILEHGLELDLAIGSTLVDTYAKCGNVDAARRVFDKLPHKDVVSWGAMIAGYARNGAGLHALKLFDQMQQEGMKPLRATFLSALKACASVGAIESGRLMHNHIIGHELESDVSIGNTLIDMYGKCGSLEEARKVFDALPRRDAVSWAAIIAGSADQGYGYLALELFWTMKQTGVKVEEVILSIILKVCRNIGAIEYGREIHNEFIRNGFGWDDIVGSSLINMYATCGTLEEACKVFESLDNPGEASWNGIIMQYAQQDHVVALQIYVRMQQMGIKGEIGTQLSILKACSSVETIQYGRLIHALIHEESIKDSLIGTALISMYAKSESLEEASRVFSNLQILDMASCGMMIAGYVQCGHSLSALELFEKMQREGINLDKDLFSSVLKACGKLDVLLQGRIVHEQILENEFEDDVFIGSTLIDMYGKCGSLDEAHEVFVKLPTRNVVSWNAMICGYSQYGDDCAAIELYKKMQQASITPDKVTFSSILTACGNLGAIEHGKMVHHKTIKSGLEWDIILGNSMVDMYAKCGNLDEAQTVFNELKDKNAASWGAMISGYARCGSISLAGKCLQHMQQKGIKPNAMTFTSIFAACSHAGLVDEGRRYFRCMQENHGIIPTISHYACMVDLFGRAGYLNEAASLLRILPSDIIACTSLLTACKTYGNLELGRRCFDQVSKLDALDAGGYVLMTNIYTDANMPEHAKELEELRNCEGAWKKPARAWIEVNNQVHEFIVGDKGHPQSNEIYAMLKRLNKKMKQEGYSPEINLVVKKTEEDKEEALCGHCEKLAIAFGLISTPQGTTIRATKNLRVCNDCHNAAKVISKVERREIIIKDAYRIHHFREGACSCTDYS